MTDGSSLPEARQADLVSAVRTAAELAKDEGPSDAAIVAAVSEFAGQFDYWFTRVIAKSVTKYRTLIVGRINSLVRPIEFEGLSSREAAERLVSDYVNRNFVTAGGWAIESMAIAIAGATGGGKASSRGIDLERTDAAGRHLYVIKSGKVTRNSDILSKLKQHARDAQKLIQQGGAKVAVFANYVVATGATSSSFEDGIHRPSSGEFWAEITGLPEPKALALVSEIAKAAGKQVTRNTDAHIGAMVTLVQAYIADPAAAEKVDWPFIFKVTMTKKEDWAAEDKVRNARASAALSATGYEIMKPAAPATKKAATSKAKEATAKLAKKGKAARGAKEVS